MLTLVFWTQVFDKILVNTLVFGFMLAGLMATLQVGAARGTRVAFDHALLLALTPCVFSQACYTHYKAQPANSVENVNYNLSLLFQTLGLASLIANGIGALATK